MKLPRDLLSSRWMWLIVLAAAIASRFYMAAEWSLWRDEERTIFFSQRPDRAFPDSFPLFFLLLRGLFGVTGVSVLAGRALVAALGVLSIVLTYVFVARLVRREVAVLAAAFLTLSVGHLFWSQSIRYYILLLVFQLIAVYLFLNGLEKGKLRQLAAVSVFLLLGVLSHLSAALLFPVFVAHIGLSLALKERGNGYSWKGYVTFAAPFLVASLFLTARYSAFAASLSSLITMSHDEQTLSLYLAYKIVGYFGAPAVALSVAAPFVAADVVPRRVLRFFVCLALIPILELLAIGLLGLAFPLWYQALIAGVGTSVLAGITLYALRERGRRMAYRLALSGAVLGSLPLFVGYYTLMHGDRPRWKEAVHQLEDALERQGPAAAKRIIYSTNPQVIEFYLGSSPIGRSVLPVRPMPRVLPDIRQADLWFVLEHDETLPEHLPFLSRECILVAQFAARTGPKDRTVAIYQGPGLNDVSAAETAAASLPSLTR
jgi:dolichyl-phosphate-mannose-protein mannosyltransferase